MLSDVQSIAPSKLYSKSFGTDVSMEVSEEVLVPPIDQKIQQLLTSSAMVENISMSELEFEPYL